MKRRICIHFSKADAWKDKDVEWIVCKKCERETARGRFYRPGTQTIPPRGFFRPLIEAEKAPQGPLVVGLGFRIVHHDEC